MKLFNIKNLFFVLALGFTFLNFNFVLADACTDICPAGKTCSFLPTCKTGCNTGCQPGYYLSDGDGDHGNNCLEETGGLCTKFNTKGVCEICPVGFYCKGGMIDKTPCPPGKYTDKIGSTKQLDCIAPPVGYCVAKATVIGTGTGSVPSVCIEKSNKIKSDNSFRNISSTTDVDIPGTINSGMGNDKGILGYTESNRLGANIAIPCPIGTYSDSTNGAANCKTPDLGYCSSYDGVNCVISDQYKGIPKPTGSDFNNAIVTALGSVNSNSVNPVTALGATKQAECPVGTYDARVAFNKDNTNPAPFCVYPDLGKKTGSSAGATQQVDCPAGQYDSRWTNSTTPNYCDDIVLNSAACSGGKCDNCKTNDQYYKFTPYSVSQTNQPQAECVACPIGTYQPNIGKTYCIYPPAGKYAPTTGISKLADLSTCSAGSYDSRSTYGFMCKTNNTKACTTNADCPSGDTCNTGGNITWTNITDAIIGESEPLNYTSGKISTSCNLCPIGTFQSAEGQAKCENPVFNSCSALNNSSVCSEQAVGATKEISCMTIPAYIITLGSKYKFYDPRKIITTPMMAPNPNCSGCQESDYGDWGLTTCQSNNTWIANRTPDALKVGNDNNCDDVTRLSFGYCDYCTANSDCGTYDLDDEDDKCFSDCSYPECPYGRDRTNYYDDYCFERCTSYCYNQCDPLSKKYCTNIANKCDSGYRIDNLSCISCSVPSGTYTWTNPGVTCDFKCNSGYMKTNYNNVPSCQICSNVPVSGMGTYTYTNPGVSCDWKCNAGYVKTNDNNIPNCRSCGSLTSNASWIDPGLSCDFKCNAGYYKVDGKCVSCDGFYNTRHSSCIWSSNNTCSNLYSCSYGCSLGFIGSANSCVSCGGLPSGASNWLYAGNCIGIDCKPGYTNSSNTCSSCSISLPLNAVWSTKNSCDYVCNPGFTLSNSQCVACASSLPANANWIPKDNNNSYCQFTCNPGFTLSNGQCVACVSSLPSNASWIPKDNNNSYCQFTCNPGFTLSNGQCVACAYNPYSQANSSYVVNNSCDYICNPGYKKDTYGTCASCGSLPLNAYWNKHNSCSFNCNKGYKLSSTTGQCVSCGTLPTGALYWTTENSCDVYCDSGYKPSGDKCVSCGALPANASNWSVNNSCYADCNPGYTYSVYYNSCQTCGSLPTNALSWTEKNTCKFDCKNGYQLSGNQCVSCGSPSSALPANAHWVTQCSWVCNDGYTLKHPYSFSPYTCE